ncbi:uncharacterized protein MONBRDRAFT_11801 [Monosiga brevicollis MX1]|uniref:Protein kinase domain-containing protein n=1 Tax=Monosiga brevicollis TaxID=81824 RepID=A9VAB6_MONBE|nr:uncharacterized protein MONBRDRAFT_11801 [Monosiga brevicollis MX1]EDQ85512.1 predicted protein [Monosiga brevicollis MX1]|eukprot:XP_001749703.1 hypothetical protein [Monosiga brevicollis MX1]
MSEKPRRPIGPPLRLPAPSYMRFSPSALTHMNMSLGPYLLACCCLDVVNVVRCPLGRPEPTVRIVTRLPQDGTDPMPANKKEATVGADKAPASNSTVEPPPQILHERYRLEEKVDVGATAIVYKATDMKRNAVVAIKAIALSRRHQLDYAAEVKIMSKLQGHPFVAQLRDHFHDKHRLYLIMDYMPNGSLYSHVRPASASVVTFRVAHRWMSQLVKAAQGLEACGMVHGDIKPDNCLIDENNNLVLHDFGTAVAVGHIHRGASIPGTDIYLAPEVLQGEACSTAQDIWAIALTWYAVLFADLPWDRASRRDSEYSRFTLTRKLPGKAQNIQLLSPKLLELLVAMLNPHPTRRPTLAHVAAFLKAKHSWFVDASREPSRAADESKRALEPTKHNEARSPSSPKPSQRRELAPPYPTPQALQAPVHRSSTMQSRAPSRSATAARAPRRVTSLATDQRRAETMYRASSLPMAPTEPRPSTSEGGGRPRTTTLISTPVETPEPQLQTLSLSADSTTFRRLSMPRRRPPLARAFGSTVSHDGTPPSAGQARAATNRSLTSRHGGRHSLDEAAMMGIAPTTGGSLAKVAYLSSHQARATSFTPSQQVKAGSREGAAAVVEHDGLDMPTAENGTRDTSASNSSRTPPTPRGDGQAQVVTPALRRSESGEPGEPYHASTRDVQQPSLELCYFETGNIQDCLTFLKQQLEAAGPASRGQVIHATGGGAYKYLDQIQAMFDLPLRKLGEMECLVRGANFLLANVADEAFSYRHQAVPQREFVRSPYEFPYVLVNIGSGVSILKVDGPDQFERIDGSALGGGTFWGLASLLTRESNFEQLLKLANEGEPAHVDMVVKDIYGVDTPSSLGLDPDLTASCLAKAARAADQADSEEARAALRQDLSASVLQMISFNIAQIACLNARLYGVKNVFFAGFFIRSQPLAMSTITQAVQYWGKGQVRALFLRHEGYLGSVGCYLAGDPSLPAAVPPSAAPKTVPPQDAPINREPLAHRRTYWLDCFTKSIDRERERVLNTTHSATKADAFKEHYLQHMAILRDDPSAYGELSVRVILELRQQVADVYADVKQRENREALTLLPEWLAELDAVSMQEQGRLVLEGAVAGNCFDWGAVAVAERLDRQEIRFSEERARIHNGSWSVNDVERWLKRAEKHPYQKAVLFVDNAGADVLLGMLPLARHLLLRGTKVILSANTRAVLNDITAEELRLLLDLVATKDETIRNAWSDGRLCVMENGSGSPCIDLSRVHRELAEASQDADLVVIEGMGRALHTNWDARFRCDVLKLAMIKNAWLAKRLNANMYDVVCRFDEAPTPSEGAC